MDSNLDGNEWWQVEKLEQKEYELIQKKSINDEDLLNDFGSYKLFNKTGDVSLSLIKNHNDINPSQKILELGRLLSIKDKDYKMLDLGCGCGYTTAAISKNFSKSNVHGVDISADAISFAKRNFLSEKISFSRESVSTNKNFIVTYDFIFCFEFYPFSRSNNLIFQLNYIKYLLGNLEYAGKIIIYQAITFNFLKNITSIKKQHRYINIRIKFIPNLKVLKIFRIKWIALFLCFIIQAILRRSFVNIVVEVSNFS